MPQLQPWKKGGSDVGVGPLEKFLTHKYQSPGHLSPTTIDRWCVLVKSDALTFFCVPCSLLENYLIMKITERENNIKLNSKGNSI